MPRKGENIYKRKDGRWEGRYIKSRTPAGKANYGYVYVTDALKQLKARRNSKQLDSLIYSVKKLEEKLSVESDFGYGKSSVINCENNIARQIQFLLDTAPCIENGDFEENLKAMNTAVMNINSLLRRRIELKKK